jgi:acyl carrier protein
MNATTELDSRIREVMADILEISPDAIRDGFGRDDAPAWDSMNHLRMVSALEETFGVQFTMREVGEMARFDTIRRLIAERLPR